MALGFRHLTSTRQLSREDADVILAKAAEMEKVLENGESTELAGKVLANLFYEPSTRTRLSFETAMLRLGGRVMTADGFESSSLSKGETLEDTITVVSQYADIIALRHSEYGSADRAASVSRVPVINAGDGPGQHPTQALIDLYTIQKECGKIDGLHIAMIGDLRFGRTVHSLCFLLGLYTNVALTFVSPQELAMPEKVTSFLQEKGFPFTETRDLAAALDADVLYMTRIQHERFAEESVYQRLKGAYALAAKDLKDKEVVVMHPLPRVGEIAPDVDALPNAAYFRQAKNGVPVRMALLSLALGG